MDDRTATGEADVPATDRTLVGGPPPPPDPSAPVLKPERRIDPWLELVLLVLLAFGIAYGIQRFVIKPFSIPSESMEDTLHPGDRVLVARFWYRFGDPQRGDVIVFHPPLRPADEQLPGPPRVAPDVNTPDLDTTFIKRVIGLPGDWVGGAQGKVWICTSRPRRVRTVAATPGCRALIEPYVKGPQRSFDFTLVPKDRYFVMGDNRDNSEDSRIIGTVPERAVIGRAVVRYWPPQRIGGLD